MRLSRSTWIGVAQTTNLLTSNVFDCNHTLTKNSDGIGVYFLKSKVLIMHGPKKYEHISKIIH